MITARCIDKIRDDKGVIKGYILEDFNKRKASVTAQELKTGISTGKIVVSNLTLTKDGRLISKKEESINKIIGKGNTTSTSTAKASQSQSTSLNKKQIVEAIYNGIELEYNSKQIIKPNELKIDDSYKSGTSKIYLSNDKVIFVESLTSPTSKQKYTIVGKETATEMGLKICVQVEFTKEDIMQTSLLVGIIYSNKGKAKSAYNHTMSNGTITKTKLSDIKAIKDLSSIISNINNCLKTIIKHQYLIHKNTISACDTLYTVLTTTSKNSLGEQIVYNESIDAACTSNGEYTIAYRNKGGVQEALVTIPNEKAVRILEKNRVAQIGFLDGERYTRDSYSEIHVDKGNLVNALKDLVNNGIKEKNKD